MSVRVRATKAGWLKLTVPVSVSSGASGGSGQIHQDVAVDVDVNERELIVTHFQTSAAWDCSVKVAS